LRIFFDAFTKDRNRIKGKFKRKWIVRIKVEEF